jgi:uncharacterized cupin superfamily protein
VTGPAWTDVPVSVIRGPEIDLAEDPDDPEGGTRWIELGSIGAGEVGIWQIDPGTVRDVEVDEVFVVLSGRATIRVDGWPDVVVAPGDVVRMQAGAATSWIVTERLRKVYLTRGDDSA